MEVNIYDKVWMKNLQKFLFEILGKFITNEDNILKLLSSKPMKKWAQAFTSVGYSYDFNYEELEFLGDAVLKGAFAKYIMKKFPDKDKHFYTIMSNNNMTQGIAQKNISEMLEFPKYIRNYPGIENVPKINGDVFESFVGALHINADANILEGMGDVLVYNFIFYIFENLGLSLIGDENPDKTEALELLVKLVGIKSDPNENVEIITHTVGRQEEFIIKLKSQTIEKINSYGFNIPRNFLVKSNATTKKLAEKIAFKKLLEELNNTYNINVKVVNIIKNEKFLDLPELKKYKSKILDKVKNDNFIYITFPPEGKQNTKNLVIITLIGVRDDNSKKEINKRMLDRNKYQNQNEMKMIMKIEMIKEYAGIE